VDEDRPELPKRRARPAEGGPTGFEPLRHSPFTVEGEIETLGRLAQGLRGGGERQSRTIRLAILGFAGVFVLMALVAVVASL
jgi:hypothetical protein